MAGGYWRRRAEANMDAVQEAASRRIDRIGDAYLRAARDLTAEVEKIIGRYADRFKLAREEALAALKAPFDEDSRAYGYRMSRAEALKESARLKAQELGAMVEKQTAAQIAYTTDEGYRLARKALKELGATASFAEPDMVGLRRSLETGWKGASYSTRVWNNVERLAETLNEEVTSAFLSGKSNARIAELITERFGSSFREAERLIRTETSYVHNQAALQGYRDAGVEEYEYLTAKDSRTCKLCGGMDGKTFMVAEAEVGVNMPPMHPFCRCTVVPVVDSALGGLTDDEKRAWLKDGAPEDVQGWLKKRQDNSTISLFANTKKIGITGAMERRILVDGEYIKPVSKSDLHKIQKAFKKNGGLILSNAETTEYLQRRGLQGITYDAKTVMLTSNPTRATVFEELIHTAQYRIGENDGSPLSRIQCEISAKEKLLKYSKAYKLTDAEIRETKKLLAQDMQDMLEYRRGEGR